MVPGEACTVAVFQSARLALQRLEPALHSYYSAGLAPSTRSTYKSGQNRYLLFCKLYHITNALPVNEQTLCYLGEEGLAIKSYLSAVRYLQISYGFPSPFNVPMPCLELILRGIKST